MQYGQSSYAFTADASRPSPIANASAYQRHTNHDAYREGRRLMAYLDHALRGSGGMTPRIKSFVAANVGEVFEVKDFFNHVRANCEHSEREQIDHILSELGFEL